MSESCFFHLEKKDYLGGTLDVSVLSLAGTCTAHKQIGTDTYTYIPSLFEKTGEAKPSG